MNLNDKNSEIHADEGTSLSSLIFINISEIKREIREIDTLKPSSSDKSRAKNNEIERKEFNSKFNPNKTKKFLWKFCDKNPAEKSRYCHRHKLTKPKLERERLSIVELLLKADKIIEEIIIKRFMNENKKFYLGCSGTLKKRGNVHRQKSKCRKIEKVFEAKDMAEGKLMEAILVHKLIFHENENVKYFLCNAKGGGGTPPCKDDCRFYVYISYDSDQSKTPGHENSMKFQEGQLSPNVISQIVLKILKERVIYKINQKENERKVKFGFCRNSLFNKRMKEFNDGKYGRFEEVSEYDEYILFFTGETITLETGENVVLSTNDIRKCGVMIISQFLFLDYNRLSHLLINDGGGGFISISKNERNQKMKLKEMMENFILELAKVEPH